MSRTQIIRREKEPSELGTEFPYDESRMGKWQEHVEKMRHLTEQHV